MTRVSDIALAVALTATGCIHRDGFGEMMPAADRDGGDGTVQAFGDRAQAGDGVRVSFTQAQATIDEAVGVRGVPWHSGLDGWAHRVELGLGAEPLSETLFDFPLLVTLNSLRFPYAECAIDGSDLRFVDVDGTHLSFEVDRWDPGGTSRLWVKVPHLASDGDALFLYYGNPAAASAADAQAVWSGGYEVVYHLNETAGGTSAIRDATAAARHATTSGTLGYGTTSPTGRGLSFSAGNSAYLSIGAPAVTSLGNHAFTFSGLVRVEDMVDGVLFDAYNANSNGKDLRLGVTRLSPFMKYYGDDLTPAATPIRPLVWQHVTFVYDEVGDQSQIYVDGALVAAGANGPYTGASSTLRIGFRSGTNGFYFTGSLDEVRLSSVARSATWIGAEARSLADGLIHYGAPETNGTRTPTRLPLAVYLAEPLSHAVTLDLVASGTATLGSDYTLSTSSLTFPAGQTSAQLELTPIRDHVAEGDEQAVLTLVLPPELAGWPYPSCPVTIVDEANQAPVALDDALTLTAYTPSVLRVLDNDRDGNDEPLTITGVTAPAHGVVENLGRQLRYTPADDHPGTDSFSYTVTDGTLSDTATVTVTLRTPFTWTGGGADANWSTAANWAGGAVPDANSAVYFNGLCGTSCTPVINADARAWSLRLASAFTGTLQQAGGVTLTVDEGGYRQYGGTFAGSSGTLTCRAFELAGGTFQAGSGAINVNQAGYSSYVDSDFIVSGGSFVAGTGTVAIWGANAYSRLYRAHVDVGTTPFYNLKLSGQGVYFALTGTITVLGNLILNAQSCGGCNFEELNGGVLEVYGNVTNDSYNLGFYGNSTIVRFVGANNHLLVGPSAPNSGSGVPTIELDTTGNVTLQGYHLIRGGFIARNKGTVTANGSIMRFCGSATVTTGGITFDSFNVNDGQCSLATTLTFTDALGTSGPLVLGGATLLMGGHALSVGGLLTFPTGATLNMSGGTLSYGSVTPTMGTGGTLVP